MTPNAPKTTAVWTQKLRWVCLSLGLAPLALAPGAWAQQDTNPLNDFRPTAEQGSGFSGSRNGLSVFDLIHQSRFGTLDMEAFSQEQQQNLDDAAAQFRKQQRERLGMPQPELTPPVSPDSPNPSL